jgi:hypothetical protein
VDSMPADWFGRETHELLAAYCRHIVRGRILSDALAAAPQRALGTENGLKHYERMAAAAERESRAATAIARALRMTPASRIRPDSAGRRMANAPIGPAPWEFHNLDSTD